MIKAVFFDFDGTIADTFPIFVRAANQLLTEMHKPIIANPSAHRDHGAIEALRATGIPIWKLPFIQRRIIALMANEMQRAPIFDGMPELIEDLREHYLVGVISSNGQEIVEDVLRTHKIGVDFVQAGSSIFGKHLAIKAALRTADLSAHQAVYVGDEIRDVHACKRIDVPICSVTWGFNSEKALRAEAPDALVKTPAALFQAIKRMDK